MKLYRKIEEKLEEWSKTNYGLLVYGSRQVWNDNTKIQGNNYYFPIYCIDFLYKKS